MCDDSCDCPRRIQYTVNYTLSTVFSYRKAVHNMSHELIYCRKTIYLVTPHMRRTVDQPCDVQRENVAVSDASEE